MSDLGDLLIQYLTMSGNANAAPPSTPIQPNTPQMGSQGVLGQGLLNQRQQMEQVESGQQMPPPAPSSSSGSPAAAPPVQSQIRPWAFTHLPPEQWTPEETAYFNKLHGIDPDHSLIHLLAQWLKPKMEQSAPTSTAGGTQ